jgi:hypothetical protein
MPRRAHAFLLAAVTSTSLAGGVAPNRWVLPIDGDWDDSSRWSLGVYPGQQTIIQPDVLIDATGGAYTIRLDRTITRGIGSLILDSSEATLLFDVGSLIPASAVEPGFRRFDINAGAIHIERSFRGLSFDGADQPNRIGANGALRVGVTRSTQSAFVGGRVSNEGEIYVGNQSSLVFVESRGQSGVVNESTGEVILDGGALQFTSLVNHGTIRSGDARAGVLGAPSETLAYFENHGSVEARREDLDIHAIGHHTGDFFADGGAVMSFFGQHSFDNAALTGGGIFAFYDVAGPLGSLTGSAGVTLFNAADVTAHFSGDLRVALRAPTIDFHARFDANTLSVFNNVDEVRFHAPIHASGFFSSVAEELHIHQGLNVANTAIIEAATATIDGPIEVGALQFYSSVPDRSAGNGVRVRSAINVVGDAEITGVNANRPVFERTVTVGGDLTVMSAGAIFQDRVVVANDATFSASNSRLESGIDAGGRFVFNGGYIAGAVAAQDVIFTRSLGTDLDASLITADTVTVQGTELRFSARPYTITGNLAIQPALGIIPSRVEATLRYFANQHLLAGPEIVVGGDVSLSGDLEVLVSSNSDPLALGLSLTLLEAGGAITGEFDRLFLPSLSDGLFFDVVYEPSAVRLVVVPAPGAVSVLALAGFVNARRARRISNHS